MFFPRVNYKPTTFLIYYFKDFSEVIDGKFETAVHCTVKVELKDGTYHEDVGYGQGIHKTCKGLSMKKARKVLNVHIIFKKYFPVKTLSKLFIYRKPQQMV
jgi:hypothetical protein